MEIKVIVWYLGAALLAVSAAAGGAYLKQISMPMAAPAEAAKPEKAVGILEPITEQDRAAAALLVKKISQDKATVSEVFRGPSGFVGVVINPGENKFIGWMPPARDTLIVGAMFDQNGKNVTQAEMVARGYARPDLAPTAGAQPTQAAIQQAVERTFGFVEGTAGPVVTAFVDYNCGFCRDFYQRTRPLIARGVMRIKWVPVAILADTSMPKAAAVLGYKDPYTNVNDPVKGMSLAENGTLSPIAAVPQSLSDNVSANGAVLNLLNGGQPRTPTLVIHRDDGTYNVSPALPQDIVAFVKGNEQ